MNQSTTKAYAKQVVYSRISTEENTKKKLSLLLTFTNSATPRAHVEMSITRTGSRSR